MKEASQSQKTTCNMILCYEIFSIGKSIEKESKMSCLVLWDGELGKTREWLWLALVSFQDNGNNLN